MPGHAGHETRRDREHHAVAALRVGQIGVVPAALRQVRGEPGVVAEVSLARRKVLAEPRRGHRVQGPVVHGGEVVALHEVLGQALPVRVPRLRLAVTEHHVLHVVVAHQGHEPLEPRRERRRLPVEVDEEESLPHLRRDLGQPAARRVEIIAPLDERRPQQPAPQVVGPRVVRALEMLRAAATARDRHPAVPAHVGEHPKPVVVAPHHQQRLTEQVRRPVVAGRRRLLGAADAHPLPAEQLLGLDRQEFGGRVEVRRHAPCLSMRTVEAGAKRLAHALRGSVPRELLVHCHVSPHLASGAWRMPPERSAQVTADAPDPVSLHSRQPDESVRWTGPPTRTCAVQLRRASIAPPRTDGSSVSSQSVRRSGTDLSSSSVYG